MTLLQILLQITTDTVNTTTELISNSDQNSKIIAISVAVVMVSAWIALLINQKFRDGKKEQHIEFKPKKEEKTEIKDVSVDKLNQNGSAKKNDSVGGNAIKKQSTEEQDIQTNKDLLGFSNPSESPLFEEITKTTKPKIDKYICFDPTDKFEQKEPLHFPIVYMPSHKSRLIIPKYGRVGRKGFTEDNFQGRLQKMMSNEKIKIKRNHVLVGFNNTVYTPDICLEYKSETKEIYFDIEIDEPYVGENDFIKRKPTHFSNSPKDRKRNKEFTKRGWIVIRFAEEQIHLQPIQCCLFLCRVIKALDETYEIPFEISTTWDIQIVKQWSEEEAEEMSRKKHREKYLGISSFGRTGEDNLKPLDQTEEEKEIEIILNLEEIIDEPSREKEDDYSIIAAKETKTNEGIDENLVDVHRSGKLTYNTKEINRLDLPLQPYNLIKVITVSTNEKIAVFEEMIQKKQKAAFTYRQKQDIFLEDFQPSHCTREILSGYCNIQKRNIQFDLRFIINIYRRIN